MSIASIRGRTVLSLELKLSLWGPWTARATIDGGEAISGSVILSLVGSDFVGTVRESRAWGGRTDVRMIGGRGALRDVLDAKHYGPSTDAGLVAADLAIETGETLADGVRDALSALRTFDSFHRQRGQGRTALAELARSLGETVNWRVLGDGSLWIGEETWSQFRPVPHFDSGAGEDGVAKIAPTDALLRPGVNLDGKRVSQVTYRIDEGRPLRAEVVLLKDANCTQDRRRCDERDRVRSFIPELPWLKWYEGVVVSQDATSGLLEVDCEDEEIGFVTDVAIWHGLPGVEVKVEQGARVMVFFAEGRPDRARAALFETNAELVEIVFDGGSNEVARVGDRVHGGFLQVTAPGGPGPCTISYFPASTSPTPPAHTVLDGGLIDSSSSKLKN